jgi:predicted transposase YdaD
MFIYFSSLYKKHDLPIFPVVIFSFDEPRREEPNTHTVTFPGFDVLKFEFVAIQLNQMSWRQYLTQQNPVAAALMSKMRIPPAERPQVKAECLRLLTTLRLDPARMELISGFIDTYLTLNETEEQAFQQAISTMGLDEREEYMEITTSWERKGIEKGRQEGRQATLEEVALNSLREGLAVEAVVKITGLPLEKVQQLQAELQTTQSDE